MTSVRKMSVSSSIFLKRFLSSLHHSNTGVFQAMSFSRMTKGDETPSLTRFTKLDHPLYDQENCVRHVFYKLLLEADDGGSLTLVLRACPGSYARHSRSAPTAYPTPWALVSP